MLLHPASGPPLTQNGGVLDTLQKGLSAVGGLLQRVHDGIADILKHPRNEGNPLREFAFLGNTIIGVLGTIRQKCLEWMSDSKIARSSDSHRRRSFIAPGAAAVVFGWVASLWTINDQLAKFAPTPQELQREAALDTMPGKVRSFSELPDGNILGLRFLTGERDRTANVRIFQKDESGTLCIDIDGTLLTNSESLPPLVITALKVQEPTQLVEKVEKRGQCIVVTLPKFGKAELSFRPDLVFPPIAEQLRKQTERSPTVSELIYYEMTIENKLIRRLAKDNLSGIKLVTMKVE